MTRLELITVGKELLIGRTLNSNAHWIGGRLARLGSMIDMATTVTDSIPEISSALKDSLRRRAHFVIVVGGLGPTPDDMTLKAVAHTLKLKLERNSEAVRMVKEHYKRIGQPEIEMTTSRLKMATLPGGATPLYNSIGTAPGVRIEYKKTVIFCLPGVPREMKHVFNKVVKKEIEKAKGKLFSKTTSMNLKGIFESALAPILRNTMKRYPGAYIKSHPKGVEEGVSKIELVVQVTSLEKERARNQANEIAGLLKKEIRAAGGTIIRTR